MPSHVRHQAGIGTTTESQQSVNAKDSPAPPNPQHQRQQFLEGLKYGAAGGVAGAFAKSCTAPLARLTILYQVQGFSSGAGGAAGGAAAPPKLRHALVEVVRREGPAALWKGNLATILHRLPYSSINFYTYEHANRFLAARLPPNTDFVRRLTSGALAGLLACSAAYPLDLVRTRLAAQTQGRYYHGIRATLATIVADEGPAGLYRGLGATLLQVVPSLALSFSLYDSIRNACMRVQQQADRQQHPAALTAAAARLLGWEPQRPPDASSSSSSSSSVAAARSAESRAHSLAVASSVDQGISHSQMLIWHLNDDAAETCSGLQRAGAAAAAAEDAYAVASQADTGAAVGASAAAAAAAAADSRLDVPAGISLVSGCISGLLTATVTFPLDVIRRRMQVVGQRSHHAGGAASYRAIIRQILQQGHGLRGFYVGILPEYCKVVPGVAIAFCTYEQAKQWLQAK